MYYHNTRKDNFTIATPEGIRTAEAGGYRKVRIEGYIRIKNPYNVAPEQEKTFKSPVLDTPKKPIKKINYLGQYPKIKTTIGVMIYKV